MNRFSAAILLIITLYLPSRGQDVTVSALFDTSRIYLGDQTWYSILIEQPADIEISIKPLKDSLVKNIEILSGPLSDTSDIGNGRLRLISKYLVTSFDSGYYRVPPVYAEIISKSGIKRYYSDYSLLEVLRVKIAPPDTASKIFDIIKPYRAPLTAGEILPWVLLAILIAAIIRGAVWLIKKFGKAKVIAEPVINPDPAHVIAFRDLERLRDEKLWQNGEVKLYYTRLTEILRQYLENRYKVFSLEMTTSETLEALVKTGFKKDESFQILKTILNGSDLVKFAKFKPESSDNETHFENAWKFVEMTRQKEEIVSEAENNNKKEGSL
jgi:hypothetical protein